MLEHAGAIIRRLERRWRDQIQIGSRIFKNKAEAARHIKRILACYANSSDTEPVTGEDRAFMDGLAEMHPRARVLIGCGISEIRVQRVHGQFKRFIARRTDSSWTPFSWKNILYPKNQRALVNEICRHIVMDQTRAFSLDFWAGYPTGRAICPIDASPMTRAESDVDHHPVSFAELVARWLACDQLDPDEIDIEHGAGCGEERRRFADDVLTESWAEFHRINAQLRVISRHANQVTLRGGR
jgi:hypothetical protein